MSNKYHTKKLIHLIAVVRKLLPMTWHIRAATLPPLCCVQKVDSRVTVAEEPIRMQLMNNSSFSFVKHRASSCTAPVQRGKGSTSRALLLFFHAETLQKGEKEVLVPRQQEKNVQLWRNHKYNGGTEAAHQGKSYWLLF